MLVSLYKKFSDVVYKIYQNVSQVINKVIFLKQKN